MTAKEYNQIWHRLNENAVVFISRLDDALGKAGPEAVHQAKCLGWTPEMREYILKALSVYHESIRTQVNKESATEQSVEKYIGVYGEIDFPGEDRIRNLERIKADIEATPGKWMFSNDGIRWIDAATNLSRISFNECLLRKTPSNVVVGVQERVKNNPEQYQYSNDNGASWHDIVKDDYPGAQAWIFHGNYDATWFRKVGT